MNIDKNTDPKNISNFFHGYAHDFSSIYLEDTKKRSFFNKVMDKLFRQDIRDRFDTTLEHAKKDDIQSILDIGCGPGHFVIEFLKWGKDVTALDIAPGMLEITNIRVSDIEYSSNYEAILGDYMEHDFPNQFDASVVMGFFDYVKDPVLTLKKLLKDTKKEIYISFPDNKGVLALQRRFRYWLRNCPLYLYSENEIREYLRLAGCLDQATITKTNRNFFVTIRK